MPVSPSETHPRKRELYEELARSFGQQAANDFGGRPKPASAVDRLTLDTNLIQDYWRQRPRKWAIERLLELARKGTVDLVVTRYIEDDIPRAPLRKRLAELPALQIGKTGGLFTFGASTFGGSDFFGSDAFLNCQQAFVGWRPAKGEAPDARDWNHLHAHYAKRRDYFLTWDQALVELGAILEAGFPLGVTSPDQYLQRTSAGLVGVAPD